MPPNRPQTTPMQIARRWLASGHSTLKFGINPTDLLAPGAKTTKRVMDTSDAAAAAEREWDEKQCELFSSDSPELTFLNMTQWLDPEAIATVVALADGEEAFDPGDRGKFLLKQHTVRRVELDMLHSQPGLWAFLMQTMYSADAQVWRAITREHECLWPEVEILTYDVEKAGEACAINPHTDNESVITFICMLSESGDYTGGQSYFLADEENGQAHVCSLEQGDCIVFRGEKLTHWISPVTQGKRSILQIELARVQRGGSGSQIQLDPQEMLRLVTDNSPPPEGTDVDGAEGAGDGVEGGVRGEPEVGAGAGVEAGAGDRHEEEGGEAEASMFTAANAQE